MYNMQTSHGQYLISQIKFVSSQDKKWEVGYFDSQYHGLAELVSENDIDSKYLKTWKQDSIELARALRTELLKRFNLVCLGFELFHIDGTPFSFSEIKDD